MTTDSYELPPMPEPAVTERDVDASGDYGAICHFTADQMREYALLAVKAERERCARIAERSTEFTGGHGEPPSPSGREIAASIRGA